ncbi:MAG: HAD family hydrolase [Christensenellales bacterium]
MAVRGVIFDMDGLLFDTEGLGIDACVEAGALQGAQIAPSLVLSTLGSTTDQSAANYRKAHPDLDLGRFWDDYRDIMRAHTAASGPPLKPGAGQLLDWLEQRQIPIGLCSASPETLVRHYLDHAGLTGRFAVIVHGRADLPSKPAPDMYLLAAQLLDRVPEHCLVLEDSPNGLRAGRAAGMQVIMIPDLIPFSSSLQPFCDAVLADLSLVPAYIGEH